MGQPVITLYEQGPTRSARCRWTLLEAGLEYESIGNSPAIIHSEQLRRVHPLGKLPAAIIDGKPLFESAAISTAIADLVPDQGLVGRSGTWSRALHEQWVCFALTEMEAWASCAELNTSDFVLPSEQHVPQIIAQCEQMYRRAATVVDGALEDTPFLVDGRFTVTDIIVGYTVVFGQERGWNSHCPHVLRYLERLLERPHCTLPRFD